MMRGLLILLFLILGTFGSEIIEHFDEDGDGMLNKEEFWEFYERMFSSGHQHEHEHEEEEANFDESNFLIEPPEEEETEEHSHSHAHEENSCLYPSQFWMMFDTNNNSLFEEAEVENLTSTIVSMKIEECSIIQIDKCAKLSVGVQWVGSIFSAILVSLLSLIALILLPISNENFKKKLMNPLLAFAIGALCGDAILHLIPESLGAHSHGEEKESEDERAYLGPSCMVLIGILVFYLVETQLHRLHHKSTHKNSVELPNVDEQDSSETNHKHSDGDKNLHLHRIEGEKHVHAKQGDSKSVEPIGYLSLVADGVHNFVDGLALGAAWTSSAGSGIATTIAVIVHEIPQELSDFAILIKAGFSRRKALFFNLLSALSCVLGAIIGTAAGSASESVEPYFLGLIAGGFLYISLADMLHELMHIHDIRSTAIQILFILLGYFVMLALALWGEGIEICLENNE